MAREKNRNIPLEIALYFFRYVIILAVLALIWVPTMNFFGTSQWQVWETLAVALVAFMLTDKIYGVLLLGEKLCIW